MIDPDLTWQPWMGHYCHVTIDHMRRLTLDQFVSMLLFAKSAQG